MQKKSLSTLIAVAVAATGVSVAPRSVGAALEEVIVTARKREEAVQDTPISVSVFTAENLEKRGVTEFSQLSYNNPNVKIIPGGPGSAISTTVAIRGNLQNDPSVALDSAVGTYIDGMIVSRTFGMNGSMVDIESVQTLKGPQGTLFGRNTTGGAVVITTKGPELGEVSGYIKGEAAQLDSSGITAAVNLPVADNLALRLVGYHSERNGYVKLSDGREYGDQQTDMVRAKLLWNISDATSLLLSGETVNIDATPGMNVATQPNHPQLNNVSPIAGVYFGGRLLTPLIATDEKNTADVETINANLTHETGWGEVKLLAGRRLLDVGINMTLPPGLGYTKQDKPDNEQTSVELQLNGSFFDDSLELTSGLYYFDETTNEDQATFTYAEIRAFNPAFPAQVSGSKMKTDIKSKSLYAQGTYHLTDLTNLTLGGRFTSDERESTGAYNSFGVITPETWKDDRNKFNFLVSLDHRFADGVMGYGSVSTGYRSAGANIGPAPASSPGKWPSFSPETLVNYELGVKSDWLDGRLRVNAAAFYQDYSDYQYTQIVLFAGVPTRTATTSDAEIKGGELEVTALLPADITLSLSYGYVDGKETQHDSVLPNIPKNTWGLALSKQFNTGIGDIDLTANYDYRDDYFTQIGTEKESLVDSRGLLNVSAALTHDAWQAVAYVNNVTDERYYNYITSSPASPAAGGLFGLSFASVGLPRVAGVKVTYNF